MNRKRIMPLAVLICLTAGATGNRADVIEQIYANNLELQAAKQSMEGDVLSAKAENVLSDPEVEMEYMFAKPERGIELSVSEEFEWPGIYIARNKYIKHRISAMEYIYESKRIEVMLQAQLILADLANINKRIQLQRQIHSKQQSLLEAYTAGMKAGELSIIDVNKLKIEQFNTEATLKELNLQKNVILESLHSLNGGKEIEGIADWRNLEHDAELKPVEYYLEAYKTCSPDYLAAMQTDLANKQATKVAKMGYLPKIRLGYKFQHEGKEHTNGFMIGLNIPVFSNRNKVNASKAAANAAYHTVMNETILAESKIRSDYAALLMQEQLIAEYSKIVEDKDLFEILDLALEKGLLSLLDYLTETKMLIEAKEKLYEMQYQYSIRLAELSKYDSMKR